MHACLDRKNTTAETGLRNCVRIKMHSITGLRPSTILLISAPCSTIL